MKKGTIIRTILFLFLLLGLHNLSSMSLSCAGEATVTLNGDQFSPLSVGAYSSTQLSGHSCKLFGILRSAYAIYDFRVPKYLASFAAGATVKNARGEKIDVYLYNYGTKREQELLSKPDLENRWIRWESVLVDGDWRSRSPEFIWATTRTGALDFLGPYGVVRLMFYADGGLPPDEDEVYFIDKVSLIWKQGINVDSLLQALATDKVRREGDFLVTEGIGRQAQGMPAGQARAMAVRAATVEAQRNFALILGEVEKTDSGSESTRTATANVPGARTRDTQYLEDGSVKVIMELPISVLKRK
jgi:hypothetical protein